MHQIEKIGLDGLVFSKTTEKENRPPLANLMMLDLKAMWSGQALSAASNSLSVVSVRQLSC